MPERAKEKEMAGKARKYGSEVKLSGFTRGGVPVGKRSGAKSNSVTSRRGDGFTPAEIAALGLAGALTAGAGGLMVGALKYKGKK
jgi:hypothetical protein